MTDSTYMVGGRREWSPLALRGSAGADATTIDVPDGRTRTITNQGPASLQVRTVRVDPSAKPYGYTVAATTTLTPGQSATTTALSKLVPAVICPGCHQVLDESTKDAHLYHVVSMAAPIREGVFNDGAYFAPYLADLPQQFHCEVRVEDS